MPAQAYALFVSVVFSYFWVMNPSLQAYSVQLVAALALIYFGMKRLAKAHLLHLAPSSSTLEIGVFLSMLLILIGHTGGISSIFLPLLYLLLFIAVLTMHTSSIITLEILIPLFLWAISAGNTNAYINSFSTLLTPRDWASLLSFPILLPLLVFARHQYKHAAAQEQELVQQAGKQVDTTLFIATFLKPKLRTILEMSEYPIDNKETIQRQLTMILEETETVTSDSETNIDSDKKRY